MANKKLVVDARMLRASGIGTYLSNLLPRISQKLLNSNLDIEVICRSQDANFVADNRIINNSAIYSVSEQLTRLNCKTIKADLFWSPHYNIPVFNPAKQIVTIHDVFHLAMPEFVGGINKKIYANMLFSAVKYKAEHVICDSEFTKSELMRLTKINHDKVTVIYPGISGEWFNIAKAARPYGKAYILYVGNVKPHKNLHRLLQAFESLSKNIPHDLVIVGNKEGFITGDHEVINYAKALNDRVYLSGYVDDKLLKQYFVHADCLIFPSLYEGFGFPPLEAMACGCPVIVSTAASLPEVCGDAALYCDPYDVGDIALKIKTLLDSRSMREDSIARGLERARRFSWERTTDQTLSIIHNAIN